MTLGRITTGLQMTIRMLVRRRIILIALIFIPTIFLGVVEITGSPTITPFQLASLKDPVFVELEQRVISLIFFSVTSCGFLVSLLALNLVQIDQEVSRRLIICGYHPVELLISKLLTILLIIVLVSTYVGLLTHWLHPAEHFGGFVIGLAMTGFVYGSYGMLVGSILRGELEGIFLIVLLANIDVGWLQNPVFFAEAQNREMIKYLPGYFPSQSAIIAAVSDFSAVKARISSFLYGIGLLAVALAIYYLKMRKKK